MLPSCFSEVWEMINPWDLPLSLAFSPHLREKVNPSQPPCARKSGVRQSLSGEVPDQQAIITLFLLDESFPMKSQ
jgi:hypothetical protein